MRNLYFIIFVFVSFISLSQNKMTRREYIEKYKKDAIKEMILYNIPASITLAQGVLETANGNSPLVKYANNHFGIKCKTNWRGEKYYHTDDAPNECFRKYSKATESYRDHSLFLKTRTRYNSLFKLNLTDYKAWSYGLKKAGYATNPNYPKILINIIETYKLYELDRIMKNNRTTKNYYYTIALKQIEKEFNNTDNNNSVQNIIIQKNNYSNETKQRLKPNNIKISKPTKSKKSTKPTKKYHYFNKNNKTVVEKIKCEKIKNIVLKKNTNISYISNKYNIKNKKLLKYNDLTTTKTIKTGEIIYLKSKKNKTPCDYKYHIKKENETMYDISQMYCIKLKKLYKLNGFFINFKPLKGTKLILK